MAPRRGPVPPWFAHLQEGDVLKTPSGDYRVVRAVYRAPDGWLRGADFAIRRASWTRRPYTALVYTDLKRWTYVGARVKLASPVDALLREECVGPWTVRNLTPADVRGLP